MGGVVPKLRRDHAAVGTWRLPDLRTLGRDNGAVNATECEQHGHDYEVISDAVTHEPRRLVCRQCGRLWPVDQAEQFDGTARDQ
jgi:hypothetical protein